MRLFRVIKKEILDFLRDRGFILTLILEPLILILVFGYTFQADIDNLNTIVIDLDNTDYSSKIISAVETSEYFRIIEFTGDIESAKDHLEKGNARAIFYIPDGFGKQLNNANKSDIELYIDSSDYTIYNIIKGASAQVMKDSLQDIVQIIVFDLEAERDLKQERVDEVQALVDSIEQKADFTIDKVDSLYEQFNILRTLISDTEQKISETTKELDNISSSLDNFDRDIGSTINSLIRLRGSLLEIRSASPSLAEPVDNAVREINILRTNLDDLLKKVNEIDPSTRINISDDYFNIPEFTDKLDSNELEVKSIDETAKEIEQIYKDIQQRIDSIHLELKTLQREFLAQPMDINKMYLYGEITYFQYLTPAILTLILFFIGVVLTTVNIVDERNSKTLFRIATTPLKKWELVGGKFIVFFIIGIIEAVYVLLLAIFLFKVIIIGSIPLVFLVLILLMAASIGLGLLISAVVKTMRQAIMLVPLVLIPSVLISQTFSPIEVMPIFMQYVAYFSPMFYSNVALREIMIKGSGIEAVILPIIILGIYALITVILGIIIYKKRIE
ncbi:MAG: ABC transporter permease [Candidatus Woesearchaeota archaeon]